MHCFIFRCSFIKYLVQQFMFFNEGRRDAGIIMSIAVSSQLLDYARLDRLDHNLDFYYKKVQ